MRDGRLLTGYRSDDGVGRMEKRDIGELEPYLEKRNGFSWLPEKGTDYYVSEAVHANLKYSQQQRDVMHISDYLCWSVGNFFLFFVGGIICIILSVRVREHKRTLDYDTTLKISNRTFYMNIFSTVFGVAVWVTFLGMLVYKSTTSF